MENGVLPSLWLSYRYLPSTLKQCFAYCSLFPQDYQFNKKEIVYLWMAEGFLRSHEKGKSTEEVGVEYFDDLVSRSLFQRSSKHKSLFFTHDLVHDLAAFALGEFCLRIEDESKNVTSRTRHLTYKGIVSSNLLTSLSTSKHLRTILNPFIKDPFGASFNLDDFVKRMAKRRFLRVVYISTACSVLHNSLGDLKMLRDLNLCGSKIEELSNSICSLFHLQTLILSGCENLTRLPMDLPRKLSKLQHLDTEDTSLRKMPPKMGSLKELRVLNEFVVGEGDGSGCSTLKDLGELHQLGELGISKLQNVDNLEHVEKANMRDKAEMKELVLRWEENAPDNMIDKAADVIDALQPHHNLEKLEVRNYPASSLPNWVGETSFSKMICVKLHGGRSSVLPPLGQLPSLRELYIWEYQEVEKIGKELLYGNDTNSSITPFPSLEKLSFYHMESWKEWSFAENESSCFPRLKELFIIHCQKLESVIDRPQMDHHWPSLCSLLTRN